mgnify:CR=1 FL=1
MREKVLRATPDKLMIDIDIYQGEIRAKKNEDGVTIELSGNPAALFTLCCLTVMELAKRDPGHTPEKYADTMAGAVKNALRREAVHEKE